MKLSTQVKKREEKTTTIGFKKKPTVGFKVFMQPMASHMVLYVLTYPTLPAMASCRDGLLLHLQHGLCWAGSWEYHIQTLEHREINLLGLSWGVPQTNI